MTDWAIEAWDITKTYGSIRALDQVSIQVKRGEIFGFLGPNGAGKSTFIKILLNLIRPDRGRACLFGKNIRGVEARASVGFLPENIRMYTFLTIEEFLGLHARLISMPGENIESEIGACLKRVGMEDSRRRRIGTLSKGMLQRVGIAQAVLGKPRLLFLDEPTSGLDPIGVTELREQIIALKKSGATIFLNSHLLSEVERTCDRVAILNKGKIIRSGNKSDLSEKSRHLEVEVDMLNEDSLQRLRELSEKPVECMQNMIRIYPRTDYDAVRIHQIIVESGSRVMSLSWKGESLEELFCRLIKHEDMGNS